MRIAILGLLAAGLLNCNNNHGLVTPPTNPTVVVDPPRTDLPATWVEVSGKLWSYGVPKDFDQITSGLAKGIVTQQHSVTRGLTINLSGEFSDQDLHDFILHSFMPNKGIMVLQIVEKTDAPLPIVAIHSLILPQQTAGALDFFVKKDNTVYHLSCFGEDKQVKAQSEVCFNIVDTLRIK